MRGKHVLCVDDDPDILKVRKLLLESKGYSVITAGSGQQALEHISKEPDVDLVLLDYRMPGMNGDELAQKLRQQFPSLRLIAVSGVEDLPEQLLKNVDASVPKASDPELLLSAIAQSLRRAERGT
jgi:CheY-like chemotaxis protein